MMKVYQLWVKSPYDGNHPEGYYRSKEKAEYEGVRRCAEIEDYTRTYYSSPENKDEYDYAMEVTSFTVESLKFEDD